MPTQQTFDGASLEAVLDEVAAAHGPSARVLRAEKVRTGGVAGFFARERFEVTVAVDEEPQAPLASAPTSLLELADQVSESELALARPPRPDGPATPTSPAVPRPPAGPALPSTEGRMFHDVLRAIVADAGLLDAVEADQQTTDRPAPPAAPPAPSAPPAPPASAVERSGPTVALAALGLPHAVLAGGANPPAEMSPAQQLLRLFEGLPRPRPLDPRRRGDIVVVVGDADVAVAAARVAARELGQTPGDVVVAAPRDRSFLGLRTPEEAARRGRAWRSCLVPSVIAVCAAETPEGADWAREMVEALEPTTTWAAVSARRDPDHVARWTRALGDVDALSIAGCADAPQPAALLALGIPVATLEGRRATPAAWTAMLVDRLAA